MAAENIIHIGYELPINLQNFVQKDFTEVKIFEKVLWGGATFLETPFIVGPYALYIRNDTEHACLSLWRCW